MTSFEERFDALCDSHAKVAEHLSEAKIEWLLARRTIGDLERASRKDPGLLAHVDRWHAGTRTRMRKLGALMRRIERALLEREPEAS